MTAAKTTTGTENDVATDVETDVASAAHPRFVTFEGVDGAGKSTHLAWFAAALASRTAAEVVVTREPGGTRLGEALRAELLHRPMHLETEALLMFADRRQHIADVIAPALDRGAWVLCDRFTDSTVAYQGAGRGLARDKIDLLRAWVHADLEPGLTVLFDLAPEIAKSRMESTRSKDRFEEEGHAFFVRVRNAYLQLAQARAERFRVVDGSQSVEQIRVELENIIRCHC